MTQTEPTAALVAHVAEDEARVGAAWNGAWALGVALGTALLLTALGSAPLSVLAALGCGMVPGLLGWAFRPRPTKALALLLLWAAGCAFAMALTGGVSGPLMAWGLAPLLAAAALGGLWRDGVIMSCATFFGVGLIQAAGKVSPAPAGESGFATGLIGLATVLGGATAVLMVLSRDKQAVPNGPEPRTPERMNPEPTTPVLGAMPHGEETAELQARLAEAEDARAAAEADSRARMRFLANMSHELRTPLNAIMGFSDIMRARLFGELTPKYAEYAELIHESGRHLLDLISDLLDISKMEAEKYVLSHEFFDAREPVNAALRLVRGQADEAGVALRGDLPPVAVDVNADRRAVKQIVLNLVSNALKHTPAGGSVIVTAQPVGDSLELIVADTGVGIAPDDLKRLGRPFEQAGDSVRRAQGTGLGLSLVKAFARLHGGDMVIESRLRQGTAVTVRLPVLAGRASAPAEPTEGSV